MVVGCGEPPGLVGVIHLHGPGYHRFFFFEGFCNFSINVHDPSGGPKKYRTISGLGRAFDMFNIFASINGIQGNHGIPARKKLDVTIEIVLASVFQLHIDCIFPANNAL